MTNLSFNFSYPWLLLLLIPAVLLSLLPYFRIQKKYRRNRNRIISLVAHMVAIVLAVFLLSGMTLNYEIPNESNEIILLVDVSASNKDADDEKDAFVSSVIDICDDEYKVGIIKFGYDQIYAAPISDNSEEVYENYLSSDEPDTSATDYEAAIEFAMTKFTNPETAKIVLITDGIETDGNVQSIVKQVASKGIRIDTVYFPNEEHDEVQVVEARTPEHAVRVDEKFNVGLTIQKHMTGAKQNCEATINVCDNGIQIGEPTKVLLTADEQVVEVECSLSTRGTHELSFEVTVDDDTVTENNRIYTFMKIESFDQILVIEKNEGESSALRGLLIENNYKVTDYSVTADVDEIPHTVKDLCAYEQVILVNVAYSDMEQIAGFESALNEYVYNYGGGLFTVGGENETDASGKLVPHAYNRADMERSTYYKNMLPVLTVDYTPPIAVAIVVDTSGSMSKEKLAAAKNGAQGCLDALSDRDYCGVVSFAAMAKEEAEILPVSKREQIREAINNVGNKAEQGSDGTVYASAVEKAGRALSVVDVERRHVILVTDGEPGDSYNEYSPYIESNFNDGITLSIVTVNCAVNTQDEMNKAAELGGGKFYNVQDYNEIPGIMQRDLALEAIAEIDYGKEFTPKIKEYSSVVAGIHQEDIPALTGYYGTVAKDSAKVSLVGAYVPIYAQWEYGEGKVGSFMSDLNGTWSGQFISDPIGQTLINNMIQSLFPSKSIVYNEVNYVLKRENYKSQLNVYGVNEGETVEVTVMSMNGTTEDVKVVVEEPNKRFTYEILYPGVYDITIVKKDADGNVIGQTLTRDWFSYSDEYNEFPSYDLMGEELLQKIATDGDGELITDSIDVFSGFAKRLARSFDPRFLFLILSIIAVLIDIAVRKFKFKWPHELIRDYKAKKANEDK